MNSQSFGEYIKALRLHHGFSLSYVSGQISYGRTSLSRVEKGKTTAPEHILEDLAALYEVPYTKLSIKYHSENIYYSIRAFSHAREVLRAAQKRLEKDRRGTKIEKNKDAIIAALKAYFTDKAIHKAWLFGSFARNTGVSKDSDIDILVSFKQPNTISLFDLIQMKDDLYKETGREVDLVEEGQQLAAFQGQIDEEKILIYASDTN